MKDNKKEEILRRVLVLADSPIVTTGFGVLAKNLLWEINQTGKYLIDIIGINHWGDYYNLRQYPYRIYPALAPNSKDPFGRPRLIEALAGHDHAMVGPWDIVFTINDHFILEKAATRIKEVQTLLKEKGQIGTEFKWIAYWPVDSALKENWVTNSIALSDYPVAYTEYGKHEILKFDKDGSIEKKLNVIYHGVNTTDFYPISKEEKLKFRREFFGGKVKDDTFLIVNTSRNQMRKDMARTLHIFAEFKKRYPDSYLYLHSKVNDAAGSLAEMARWYGLREETDWTTPANFNENIGFPTEKLNKIYNIADVTLSTTLGEGWGFMFTESMATNTLTMGPAHTSLIEILNGAVFDPETSRGVQLKCGSNKSEWVNFGIIDYERIRPLTNVDDAVEKLKWVYENPEKSKEIAERGYQWVQAFTWKSIANKWLEIFDEAYEKLQIERQIKENGLKKELNKMALNNMKRKK